MPQNHLVPRPGGALSRLNITAASVVKPTPGTIFTVNVNVLGTSTGSIHDCAAVADATAANLVAVIPEAVGSYSFTFPCATGIVVTPGAAHVLGVAFT